jgi:hypothetical protein
MAYTSTELVHFLSKIPEFLQSFIVRTDTKIHVLTSQTENKNGKKQDLKENKKIGRRAIARHRATWAMPGFYF